MSAAAKSLSASAATAIGVLDIGKTQSRLLLIDVQSGAPLWSSSCESSSRVATGLRELDITRLEQWLSAALTDAATHAHVTALVPVAHGAAAVLLDEAGGVVAAPDYEDPGFDDVTESYRALRDDYSHTLSPFLQLGLNLGRQWHWLQQRRPALHARVRQALLYPQYWAWRLCGVAASEVSSLGCHTDLWWPAEQRYSALATSQRWTAWLPPLRRAHDMLGTIAPKLAARTGLPANCKILCGIHDSNASYLCHLAARTADEAFAVVSSGTWTIIMARGAALDHLRECEDMLANVDANATPVATARFMGGREFAAIAGNDGSSAQPDWPDVEQLLRDGFLALPSFAPAGGPFAGRVGRIEPPHTLNANQSAVLATLYVALMCDRQLDALGAQGAVMIDGPLARNPLFAPLLAAMRPNSRVELAAGTAGAAQAARLLYGAALGTAVTSVAAVSLVAAAPIDVAALRAYRARWRHHTAAVN